LDPGGKKAGKGTGQQKATESGKTNFRTGEKNMDTFEQMLKNVKGMSLKEMAVAEEKLRGMCRCPGCPTHNACAKNAKELLFCIVGKSFMCISEDKGCICPSCPVAAEFGLKNTFFCLKGAEKSQRYEHALWGTRRV
jgi:hypothetical protein